MDLTLKRIPDSVYQSLKLEAKSNGRSLNSEIIELLTNAVADANHRKSIPALVKQLAKFRASLPPSKGSTAEIRRERNRH
jgi:plasmid stability protein